MTRPRPEIPPDTLANWQRLINVVARLADVPAGLVMQTGRPDHAVLLTSERDHNPCLVGQNFRLNEWNGPLCRVCVALARWGFVRDDLCA